MLFTPIFCVKIEEPIPPKYIIVSSRQRSSSSTLNRMISSHPCILHGNEMLTNSLGQDTLDAHRHSDMSREDIYYDPRDFFLRAYDGICEEARENGNLPDTCDHCTISIKLFDIHYLDPDGLFEVMNDHDFSFLVLERDVEAQYCSYERAKIANDWGTTPSTHKKINFDCSDYELSESFVEKNDKWFNTLRSGLRKANRFFQEVPFASVASCDLLNLVKSIFGLNALVVPGELQLQNDLERLFIDC